MSDTYSVFLFAYANEATGNADTFRVAVASVDPSADRAAAEAIADTKAASWAADGAGRLRLVGERRYIGSPAGVR